MPRRSLHGALAVALLGFGTAPTAAAQEAGRCALLCVPALKLEPSLTVENLFGGPRLAELEDGVPRDTVRLGAETAFELILALDVPTEIPRVGLTLEVIWTPFASTSENPFTGETAGELGKEEIRDNPVEFEAELNLGLLTAEATGGWLEAHFDVVDQLSPAERPGDASVYTHKLNLELDVAVLPFSRWSSGGWLRDVEIEGSLDYLATGLPSAGDEVGGERFLDDASPWSFTASLVLPLAPLAP